MRRSFNQMTMILQITVNRLVWSGRLNSPTKGFLVFEHLNLSSNGKLTRTKNENDSKSVNFVIKKLKNHKASAWECESAEVCPGAMDALKLNSAFKSELYNVHRNLERDWLKIFFFFWICITRCVMHNWVSFKRRNVLARQTGGATARFSNASQSLSLSLNRRCRLWSV